MRSSLLRLVQYPLLRTNFTKQTQTTRIITRTNMSSAEKTCGPDRLTANHLFSFNKSHFDFPFTAVVTGGGTGSFPFAAAKLSTLTDHQVSG
jgi:hypothetical protein